MSKDNKASYLSLGGDTVRLSLAGVVDMLWNVLTVMFRFPITTLTKGRLRYCGVTTVILCDRILVVVQNVVPLT